MMQSIFFDGYNANPEYALKTLLAARDAGADCVVLCETNGGAMPDKVAEIIAVVKKYTWRLSFWNTCS